MNCRPSCTRTLASVFAVLIGAAVLLAPTPAMATAKQTKPVWTADSPPNALIKGQKASYQFKASGRPAPTYKIRTGHVPTGLSLSKGGLLSGTPKAAGTWTFRVSAVNKAGSIASPSLTIRVSTNTASDPLLYTAEPQSGGSNAIDMATGDGLLVEADYTPAEVVAFNANTGARSWTQQVTYTPNRLYVTDGTVQVDDTDGTTHILNESTGAQLSSAQTHRPIFQLDGVNVYLEQFDYPTPDALVGESATSGSVLWTSHPDLGLYYDLGPYSVDGKVIYTLTNGTASKVEALDPATGHLLWSYANGDNTRELVVGTNAVYTWSYYSTPQVLTAVSTADGHVLFTADSPVSTQYGFIPFQYDDGMLFGHTATGFYSINTANATGSVSWQVINSSVEPASVGIGSPFELNGVFYFGHGATPTHFAGQISAYDSATDTVVWNRTVTCEFINSVTTYANRIFFYTAFGATFVFHPVR